LLSETPEAMAKERRKGGRRRGDRRAARDEATLTNSRASGTVEHDDRGDARWVWATEKQAQESADRTFDELKALDNETLTLLEQSAPARGSAPPGGGYNPYDAVAAPKKPAKARR
jgi:hypothetical protein